MIEDDYVPSRAGKASDRFIVLTGCSGSGKSSLLNALARRGYAVVPEPGRQVIREQNYIGGDATPGDNPVKFLEFTISRTMHQMICAASTRSYVFFDRSIIDQLGGFVVLAREIPVHLEKAADVFRYHRRVFVMPPWRDIFRNDAERTHGFEDAVRMYGVQMKAYERFGYELVLLPQTTVEERADFVLRSLPPL
ncbi:MAG: AAA family ATPase [Rhizomicrobium sp.]